MKTVHSLDAHISLDTLKACEQRLRAILVEAQAGGYRRDAFWESVSPIVWELYMSNVEKHLAEVAQQLEE